MENQYFVRKGIEITGPLTARELKKLAANRTLVPTDEISRDRKSWVTAGNVPGLRFNAGSSDACAFEVFISYSTQNKLEADAVCAKLEELGIRCWIAPRNILPGTEWGEGIVEGIDQSRVMVLIFSGHSNKSPQVRREVDLAISKQRPVIPFRLENLSPTGSLVYCLGNTHWLDAFDPPLEQHISRLAVDVRSLLSGTRTSAERSTCLEPMRPSSGAGGDGFGGPHPTPTDQPESLSQVQAFRNWRWFGAAIAVCVFAGLSVGLWSWKDDLGHTPLPPLPVPPDHPVGEVPPKPVITPISPIDVNYEAPIIDGPWRVDNDELVQPSLAKQDSRIVFGDSTWSRYNLDAEVMAMDGPDGCSVFFNYADPTSYRVFTLGGFQNTSIELTSRYKDEWSGAEQRRIHPGNAIRNQWYHVRIEVRGAACRCFLNNEQSAANTDERLTQGRIGLGTWETAARFRDVLVTSEDGKTTLWKGLPKLPLPESANADKGAPTTYRVREAHVFDGAWTIDGDELVQSSLAERDNLLAFGDPMWSRYSIALKAQVCEGTEGFKVYFNFADLDNYRVFTLGAWKNTSHDVIARFNASWEGASRKGHVGKIELNRWYDVRLEVRGAECRCMLDGELWFEHTDKRLTKGRIGLGTWATAVRFRDIMVTSEDGGAVLWQGNPTLPPGQLNAPLSDPKPPDVPPEPAGGDESTEPVPRPVEPKEKTGNKRAQPRRNPLEKLREVRVHEKGGVRVIKVVHEGDTAMGIGQKNGDPMPLRLDGDWIRYRTYNWNYKTKRSKQGQKVEFIYDP